VIDKFLAWIFRDVEAAEKTGYARGLDRASKIIRDTQWSFPFEGRSTLTILNEALEAVAKVIDEEERRL